MNSILQFGKIIILNLIILFFTVTLIFPFGTIIPVKGYPVIFRKPPVIVKNETALVITDTVKTGSNINAKVIYNDGTELKIFEKSLITFHKDYIRLKKGKTIFNFKKVDRTFRLMTSTSIVGILGTELSVNAVNKKLTEIQLYKGRISVKAVSGNKKVIFLDAGEKITVTDAGILTEPIKINGKSGVGNNEIELGEKESELAIVNYSEEFETELSTVGKARIVTELKIRNENNRLYKYPYRLTIDGCGIVNGVELNYPRGNISRLSNIENKEYEMALHLNGYVYDFVSPKAKKNSISKNELSLIRILISCGFERSNMFTQREIIKNVRMEISSATGTTKLHISDSPKDINDIYCITNFNEILLYLPNDISDWPALKLKYIGKKDVKNREVILQTSPDTCNYRAIFK